MNADIAKTEQDQPVREWLQFLAAESTVAELPAFDVTIQDDALTSVVHAKLSSHLDLPGVVIAANDRLLGMISRPTLFSELARPFGQELYLKRPIRLLLEAVQRTPLILPADLPVGEAAARALQRPAERAYEPVVLQDGSRFRLLDAHTLLTAQSQLLTLANDKIRSQADVAEGANQAKSLFLANMSHEIRTPLTSILGFAENLLDPSIALCDRDVAIDAILRNGHHLLQLINDILDLSKIEANRLEIERLRFSPGGTLVDVISALRFRADMKQIGLSLAYDGPIPDTIKSDPTRYRQVLMNLIGNAIKFTERGQVVIRMRMVDRSGAVCTSRRTDSDLMVECTIEDSGIGMSEEQLSRLFSPFMQADQSTARRFGGTGLGLSISRRLVRLLGGDIDVSSVVGKGTSFTVQIEAGQVESSLWHDRPSQINQPNQPEVREPQVRLSGRILLAEDGPDNQLLISSFLRKSGADITVVENGRKAVDAALDSLKQGSPFSILLMDMQMPIMDGYTATRELRSRGWTRPIIALTANTMQGDRQKCLDAGCNDFATKPINRAELIEQIHRLLTGEHHETNSSPLPSDNFETPVVVGDSFNYDLALERTGGDPDLLEQVAKMVIEMSPQWLEDLEIHLNERDCNAARRVAHSLKNTAENMGDSPVAASFLRLEEVLADDLVDDAIGAWPECRALFQGMIKSIDAAINRMAGTSAK